MTWRTATTRRLMPEQNTTRTTHGRLASCALSSKVMAYLNRIETAKSFECPTVIRQLDSAIIEQLCVRISLRRYLPKCGTIFL